MEKDHIQGRRIEAANLLAEISDVGVSVGRRPGAIAVTPTGIHVPDAAIPGLLAFLQAVLRLVETTRKAAARK